MRLTVSTTSDPYKVTNNFTHFRIASIAHKTDNKAAYTIKIKYIVKLLPCFWEVSGYNFTEGAFELHKLAFMEYVKAFHDKDGSDADYGTALERTTAVGIDNFKWGIDADNKIEILTGALFIDFDCQIHADGQARRQMGLEDIHEEGETTVITVGNNSTKSVRGLYSITNEPIVITNSKILNFPSAFKPNNSAMSPDVLEVVGMELTGEQLELPFNHILDFTHQDTTAYPEEMLIQVSLF